MDDQKEEIEQDEVSEKYENIPTDNVDYYVPMTDDEREMYENISLRAMGDAY